MTYTDTELTQFEDLKTTGVVSMAPTQLRR